MVFSNLFSSSFLFIIVIFILIGCIMAYVNYKMTEQDHKLNSMIGLISTMAEEMHFFRSKLNNNNSMKDIPATDKFQLASQLVGGSDLIEVSDNDDDLEEDDDDLEEEDDDLEEEDDDLDDIEDVEDVLCEDKMIQLTLDNLSVPLENSDIVDLEYNNDFEHNKSIKTIHLEQTFDLEETNLMAFNDNEIKEDNSFFKNININDLEEESKTDYKKMSVNKLREIAGNKGIADPSKLKKTDILKILGEE